jgi:hypothetical protein
MARQTSPSFRLQLTSAGDSWRDLEDKNGKARIKLS